MVLAATTNRRWPAMLVVALAVVASSLVQTPQAYAAQARPKCLGKKATIVGKKKADVLKGTKKADVIVGLGGNDRIMGRGGADRICGGGGKDRLLGGGGNDSIDGGGAVDECYQGAGTGLKKGCEGPKLQLTVSKVGTGSGTVTSSPSGIDCGLTCGQAFMEGEVVTLTASASTGSSFNEWAGACTGTGPCAVLMGKAQSVIASFTANPAPPPPVNDPPVAADDAASTNEDTPVTISVAANDSSGPADESGQSLTIDTVTQPAHGSATKNPSTVTYVPDTNWNGSDSFTYTVCDNGSPNLCDTATVNVTVGAVNDPPAANDDLAFTNEDSSLAINVVANDSDAEGGLVPSSAVITAGPFSGSTTNNGNGTVTYSPAGNFNGTDTFSYQVCDTVGACDSATVLITVASVNDPPLGANDATSTDEDTSKTINVVSNDSPGPANESGQTLSVNSVSDPPNGSVTINGNGTVTYVPDANFNGTDTFTYEVCDNGSPSECDPSTTVTVTVVSVNDPPVADDDAGSTGEDNSVIIDVLTGDSQGPPDESLQTLTVTTASDPANGSTTNNGNGTVTYVPDLNFNGTDTFTYQVCDNGPGAPCDAGLVTVTVNPANDPPLADDDADTTNEDASVVVDVLTGDSPGPPDESGQLLSVSSVTQPANGTTTNNMNGTVTYNPAGDFHGTDNFTYTVCDNGPGTPCDTATVTLTVNAVNDSPDAVNDADTTAEDTSKVINVVGNDSAGPNESSQNLTVTTVSDPANGSTTNNGSGTVTYAPDLNSNGTDTFTYQICDDGTPSLCDTATVTVTVSSVNDLPIADDDSATTDEDTSVPIAVLDGDSPGPANESTQTLDVVSATDPPKGSVVINANETVTYTPDANLNGTDSFSYQVCDSGTPSECDTATVTVTVNAVNDAPDAVNDSDTTQVNTNKTINVVANDSPGPNESSQTLTVTAISDPPGGVVTDNLDGTVTYDPDPLTIGPDIFTYEICDSGTPSRCDTATVTVTVTPL